MEKRIHQINSDDNYVQLELPALLHKLSELLCTPYGFTHLENITFIKNRQQVEKQLNEVTEMVGLIQGQHRIPLGETADIRHLLDKLQPENSFLETGEILQVKNALQAFGELSRFIKTQRSSCPNLCIYADRIHGHHPIVREIEGAIDPQGEIREDASPELRRIRRELYHAEREKKMVLLRIIKRYAEFSQDDIVTLRDGRMVLGIQQHYVNQVNGIVHGTSGSGATVFIEPMETLRISNEIQNLKIEERKEIIRILQFLSGLIREVREDLFFSLENFGRLDFIHAKARLAVEMQAAAPQISAAPRLVIQQVRHPLLLLKMGHQNVVPCSLSLGDNFHTLVITGPNAGGKTVALKTVGLMLLMVQLGMHIPAHPDSVVPLLDSVLVDIGDRQSLEQDLSTFSAHIIRLQEILQQANNHTLVLVDEIGTGTDPREGAALAIAFLTELTERKALSIATTHHGELKAFAYATEGVENASMEFDLETLQPTYRLQVGIPGSSYAFEIARRYGLSETVLKNAESITGPDKGQLENLILNLNDRLQKIESERRELSIKLSQAKGLQNLYQSEMERLKREKATLRQQAAEEARQIVENARAEIEHAVAEIRKSKASKEKIREAHGKVGQISRTIDSILAEAQPAAQSLETLHNGDIVWIEELRKEGELLSEPDVHQRAWVLVGSAKLQLDTGKLQKISKDRAESKFVFKRNEGISDKLEGGVLPELDLRGMDSFQAIEATDRYLDRAIGEGWEEVRIIHGKGTGVLRRKVNEFLAKDKRVEEKRLGKWGEGDTGVTVVKLRR